MSSTVCTWRDDDAAGFFDDVDGLVQVDLGVSADDLHRLAARRGGGPVSAQDHVGQGAVHGLGGEEDDNNNNSSFRCTRESSPPLTGHTCVYSPHT